VRPEEYSIKIAEFLPETVLCGTLNRPSTFSQSFYELQLDRPLDDWLDAALAPEGLQVIELSRPILVDSCRLPGPFHGDPADQLIVATARRRGMPLVTADSRIREYGHVKTIW